jgi:AsmA protein
LKWLGWLFLAFAVLTVVLISSLGHLKGPLSRAVTQATGRELLIEGDLRVVPSWVHPRFRAEKVTFANADWATDDYLLSAEAVEISVSLPGLLRGRVVVPDARLEGATLSLEMDAEGQKNWILKQDDDNKKPSRFVIRHLTLDHGQLHYLDAGREMDIVTDLSTDDSGVAFTAKGKYQGMDLAAKGRSGPVLSIRETDQAFPLQGTAKIGSTEAKIDGNITEIVGLRGIDVKIDLAGQSMEELYWIVGVAFPATSPYRTSGRLIREGDTIRYEKFVGKVGESDLAGTFQFDSGGARPRMTADLVSKVLNLADLGSLVGTDQEREKSGALPDMSFDAARWESVDADVKLRTGSIQRPASLPIENLDVRIRMQDAVLTLDPLQFGVAGGTLAGPVRLDGRQEPIRASAKIRAQNLQLNKLFPTIERTRTSVGALTGIIELDGRGDSVSQMLGSASGKIGLVIAGGEVSGLLMQMVALDLWGMARVKLAGDEPVPIRCVIADFGVKNGLAEANAVVFDTSVVNVDGSGSVNLKTEELNLKLTPKPKDGSVASLNSPLYIRGTFSAPKVAPDVGRLAAKGAGAVVMAILNPLLAVVPLLEEGGAKDSDCARLIADVTARTKAASSGRSAASGATGQRPPSKSAN